MRRNVVRVGVAYIVVAWVLAQVAEFAFDNFGAPEWTIKAVVVVLLIGLPIALIFSWAFEMTPDGVKLEKDVDRSQSITSHTGRKLDRMIIGVLVIALAWFAWDKFSTPSDTDVASTANAGSSVAVLPFVAMSNGPDDGYFADGLTEEILNSLAQLPELLVTSRTSAFSFKGAEIPVSEIAAALSVDHIVEGSVRRSGDRLRVTAQLIRTEDDTHLWSENYDSTSTDAIAVQEDIAEKIAVAMNIVLDEDKRAAMKAVGLRNPEAFTLYQKGVEIFNDAHGSRRILDRLREANVYFDQVIELAPNFIGAYIDRSDLAQHLVLNNAIGRRSGDISEEEIAAAYEGAVQNHEIAARAASTPALRALVELDIAILSGNWRGIRGHMESVFLAQSCAEGNSTGWLPNVIGYASENVERTKKQLACDPLRSLSWFNAARAQLWSGDFEGALQTAEEGRNVAPGDWLGMEWFRILLANKMSDEASAAVQSRILDDSDGDSPLVLEAMVAAYDGDKELLSNLLAKYEQSDQADPFWMISMNAWGGNLERANELAATIDAHRYGSGALLNIVQWCACGAPWDLEATPNFAARIAEGQIPWPAPTTVEFRLKTW